MTFYNYIATERAEKERKNVATKENYVAIENGRAMRRVKKSWSRHKFL